jgi:hypothetical protein
MSVWIRNLKIRLEDRPVVILHGNVRDCYIDEHKRVYDNLTALLTDVARSGPFPFAEFVFYDPVGHERRVPSAGTLPARREASKADAEFAGTEPAQSLEIRRRPTQVLAQWGEQLRTPDQNHIMVLFYLDKLIAYRTAYQEEEKEILLRLEKVIENITPNHRLVLVAL